MLYQPLAKSQIEWQASLDPLEMDVYPGNIRKTSIIATVGPSVDSVDALSALRQKGMNIVRLNASHGEHTDIARTINMVREAESRRQGRPLAIALDLRGPEIRTGTMRAGDVPIARGDELVVTTDPSFAEEGTRGRIFVDYPAISQVLDTGKVFYIDHGKLALQVLSRLTPTEVRVRSLNRGVLGSRKGVLLPFVKVDRPWLSERDQDDIQFAVDQDVDMVFASFVRQAQDIRDLRDSLGSKGAHIKIVAKIETYEAVVNFDSILKESDGIIVARGDLGIEIRAPQVFQCQKMMIAKCAIAGKPSVCATQMLESMMDNDRPTRAEVSDVANAVLDGADCLMLSGETAVGAYPAEAVDIMAETAYLAEQSIAYTALFSELRGMVHTPTFTEETMAMAAVAASLEQQAGAILLMSTSGNTARLVSKYRPSCPILVVTRNAQTARSVHLYRGCYPFYYDAVRPSTTDKWQEDVDNRIKFGIASGLASNIIDKGDTIIALQGWRAGQGATNSMRVLSVPHAAGAIES